jgi:hypothetical protein
LRLGIVRELQQQFGIILEWCQLDPLEETVLFVVKIPILITTCMYYSSTIGPMQISVVEPKLCAIWPDYSSTIGSMQFAVVEPPLCAVFVNYWIHRVPPCCLHTLQ